MSLNLELQEQIELEVLKKKVEEGKVNPRIAIRIANSIHSKYSYQKKELPEQAKLHK